MFVATCIALVGACIVIWLGRIHAALVQILRRLADAEWDRRVEASEAKWARPLERPPIMHERHDTK